MKPKSYISSTTKSSTTATRDTLSSGQRTSGISSTSSANSAEHGAEHCPWDKPIETLRSELGLKDKKTASMFQLSSLQVESDEESTAYEEDQESLRLHRENLAAMMQDEFLRTPSPILSADSKETSYGEASEFLRQAPNSPHQASSRLATLAAISSLSVETSPETLSRQVEELSLHREDPHMHLPKFLLDPHSPTSSLGEESRRTSLHTAQYIANTIDSIQQQQQQSDRHHSQANNTDYESSTKNSQVPVHLTSMLNPNAAAFAAAAAAAAAAGYSVPLPGMQPYVPNAMPMHPGMKHHRHPHSFHHHSHQIHHQIPAPSVLIDAMQPAQRAILEDIRANTAKARQYSLEDIRGFIVPFSTDQHGSRFIQQKLEIATDDEKDMLFEELAPKARMLMTDVFGNYVIQKFFEHGLPEHRRELASRMEGHIVSLSMQMYGCRVIQKALERIEPEQQAQLCGELREHVVQCIKDQNGNHVIQKCIECVSPSIIEFILEATRSQIHFLATHSYGCRVIQRILEHCSEVQSQPILNEIHHSLLQIVEDQYGNYVIQHVLEHGRQEDKSRIISNIRHHLVRLSQHKYASNVIEKCVTCGADQDRQIVLEEINVVMPDGEVALLVMMRDQFANYVVQKMLDVFELEQRDALISMITPHLATLRKFAYGKHIIAKLEKLGAIPSQLLTLSSASSAASVPLGAGVSSPMKPTYSSVTSS